MLREKEQNQKSKQHKNTKKKATQHILLNEWRERKRVRERKGKRSGRQLILTKTSIQHTAYRHTYIIIMNMNMMVDDNLDYPNLTTCQLKLIGLAANDASRPPIKLPVEIREDYMRYSNNSNSNNNNDFDDFSLERAVLRRKEERDIDSQLMGGATSKEELEKATIIKMKNITGEKDDSVCITLLKDNGYNMKESIEAYLEI